jgi:hypothetical protein
MKKVYKPKTKVGSIGVKGKNLQSALRTSKTFKKLLIRKLVKKIMPKVRVRGSQSSGESERLI